MFKTAIATGYIHSVYYTLCSMQIICSITLMLNWEDTASLSNGSKELAFNILLIQVWYERLN